MTVPPICHHSQPCGRGSDLVPKMAAGDSETLLEGTLIAATNSKQTAARSTSKWEASTPPALRDRGMTMAVTDFAHGQRWFVRIDRIPLAYMPPGPASPARC